MLWLNYSEHLFCLSGFRNCCFNVQFIAVNWRDLSVLITDLITLCFFFFYVFISFPFYSGRAVLLSLSSVFLCVQCQYAYSPASGREDSLKGSSFNMMHIIHISIDVLSQARNKAKFSTPNGGSGQEENNIICHTSHFKIETEIMPIPAPWKNTYPVR